MLVQISHNGVGYDLWQRWKSTCPERSRRVDFQPWQIQPLMVYKFEVNELQL